MSVAPYRAAARIAWRQARRNPLRSALIVALVALPVAGLSTAVIAVRTAFPTTAERVAAAMGTADISIGASRRVSAETLARELPPGTRLIRERSVSSRNVVGGSVVNVYLREFSIPVDRPPVLGVLRVLQGRAPAAPGEAALTPSVLSGFGARIGDDVTLEDIDLTLRVTGTVVAPEQLNDPVGVVGPGTLATVRRAAVSGYLVDLPPGVSPQEGMATLTSGRTAAQSSVTRTVAARSLSDVGGMAATGARDALAATGGSFAAAVVLLFGTALIAGAAFVVGARRQLRTLGLIGAAGGEPRHLRVTVLMGGVSLGAVGSLAGAALGVAGAYALRPSLDRLAGRIVGPLEIPVVPLAGAILLGTLAATLAAYGPARSAGRLSTVEALAGLTPPPRAPGKLAAVGAVAVAAGAALTAWGTSQQADPWLSAGLVVMVGGFLVAIPLLVTWAGRLAGALPTVPRLAMRDIARHGRRTGAALAAATIALGVPIAVSALTLSGDSSYRRVAVMGPDQLTVNGARRGGADTRALTADLRAAFPEWVVAAFTPAVARARGSVPQDGGAMARLVWVRGPAVTDAPGGTATTSSSLLAIGGTDLLRSFNAEDGIPALKAGKVVAIGPDSLDGDTVELVLPGGSGTDLAPSLPAVEAGATRYYGLTPSGEFNYVISPERAAQLGLRSSGGPEWSSRYILRAPGPLSDDQIQRAKAIAARYPGAFIMSAADFGGHAEGLRLIVSAVGAGFALVIVGVIVALVAAESRRDQAILVAVGAEPRTRRTLAGATAWMVALLAGSLAVPVGFAPVVVFQVAKGIGIPVVVPWPTIATVLVGVPLIAGTVAATLSRQPKATQLLRPIA